MRAEETLEQLIALVRRDADAVVANADHDSPLSVVRLLLRARDLDESLRLCRIGVLDRVGEIILHAELDDGSTNFDVRHSRYDAHIDLRALRSFAYLPNRFTHRLGELHVSVLAWVVTIRPRENQNVLHSVSHLSRVPENNFLEVGALGGGHFGKLVQNGAGAEYCADPVFDLV